MISMEASQILNTITEIETKQSERHSENKEDLKVLFTRTDTVIDRLGKLSCEAHIVRMNGIESSVSRNFKLIVTVIIIGILIGIWVPLALSFNEKKPMSVQVGKAQKGS